MFAGFLPQPPPKEATFTDQFLGFHDIIPAELIAIFNEQELELLISGSTGHRR